MSVKRYKFESAWSGGDRFEHNAYYVLASDYAALEARLERANELLRELNMNEDQTLGYTYDWLRQRDAHLAQSAKERD